MLEQAARHLLDSIEKHQATFHNAKFYWLNGRVTDRFCIDCTSRGSNGCFCFGPIRGIEATVPSL